MIGRAVAGVLVASALAFSACGGTGSGDGGTDGGPTGDGGNTLPGQLFAIKDLRGTPPATGTDVQLQSVVVSGVQLNLQYQKAELYVVDPSNGAGIFVYASSCAGLVVPPDLASGDIVNVDGVFSPYNGQAEIACTRTITTKLQVIRISKGPVPTPTTANFSDVAQTSTNAALEGSYVKVTWAMVVTSLTPANDQNTKYDGGSGIPYYGFEIAPAGTAVGSGIIVDTKFYKSLPQGYTPNMGDAFPAIAGVYDIRKQAGGNGTFHVIMPTSAADINK